MSIHFNATISITKISPSQYKNFSCGEVVLDDYIKRYAKNHEKIGIGRTFVLINENIVVGYYTLCAAQITLHDLPQQQRNQMPRYPIPASRLCRLAVDRVFQGKRIGEYLLMESIKRVLMADNVVAIHSLIVDAKNEKAKLFYLNYGFLPLDGHDLKLFLPISNLKKSKLGIIEPEKVLIAK